jgi:regulatory protein
MPSRKRGTAARGPGDRPELRLVPPLPVSGAAPPSASESAQLSASGSAAADPEAAAREVCLRMLTAAPRTRAQLYSALSRRGVPDETAEAVLGRFAEVGLIDDAMFAASWVESRHHGRGLSARALAAELRQRGVAADNIQAALDRLDPEQEVATARALVARRIAATSGQPLPARIRRLMGLLARKGYPQALAYRVVREALEQEGIDPAGAGIDLSDAPESDQDEDISGG